MKERYSRNVGSITNEEQARLSVKTALVVGLGGLGGYVSMLLSRMGVGYLRFCDYDTFEISNINRQIFCSENNIGLNKAERAVAVMQFVNSAPQYKAFPVKFDESTAEEMIRGCDVVVDALDNIESRLVLEKMCSRFKVPLVFGAVSGWTGTISTILPGHPKLEDYYKNSQTQIKPSVLPFTAATVGSWQTAEVVKVLLGRPNLVDKLLLIDLEDNATEILPF